MPFDLVKPCDPPYKMDDSKSPYFSISDFQKLLTPHKPYLLGPDVAFPPLQVGIYPFLDINPTPDGQNLVEHQFGYRYLPSFTNSVYSLVTRVLAVPPIEAPSVFPNDLLWYLEPIAHPGLYEDDAIPEYKLNLKSHQRTRILNAFEGLDSCVDFSNATTIFPKSDELLFKLKPRIIWNVPASFQAALGPLVRRMTLFLKDLLDGKRIFDTTHIIAKDPDFPHFPARYVPCDRFTLCFACGMVAEDLDEWFNWNLQLLQDAKIDWAGIFMGDDVFVLERHGDRIVSLESDFSSFDSTQRDAAQLFLQSVYRSWGCREHDVELFDKMCTAPLKIVYGKNREFSFRLKLPTRQTPTGKPDTCLGNTILSVHATVHVMTGTHSYDDFGFKAKIKNHDKFSDGTFLKGFWCLGTDGLYHWGPLPSAVMKLLKSFTPVEPRKGLEQNLSSIGPVATPLVRVLQQRFPTTFVRADTDFRVFSKRAPPWCFHQLDEFVSHRYGDDVPVMIKEVEDRLSIIPLGSVLHHPLWKILADVDYGDGRADGH